MASQGLFWGVETSLLLCHAVDRLSPHCKRVFLYHMDHLSGTDRQEITTVHAYCLQLWASRMHGKTAERHCSDSSCCQSNGLHSCLEKIARAADCEHLWALGGNRGKEKGKRKEWDKQKDGTQEEIDTASEKMEQRVVSCVESESTVKPQWPDFSEQGRLIDFNENVYQNDSTMHSKLPCRYRDMHCWCIFEEEQRNVSHLRCDTTGV